MSIGVGGSSEPRRRIDYFEKKITVVCGAALGAALLQRGVLRRNWRGSSVTQHAQSFGRRHRQRETVATPDSTSTTPCLPKTPTCTGPSPSLAQRRRRSPAPTRSPSPPPSPASSNHQPATQAKLPPAAHGHRRRTSSRHTTRTSRSAHSRTLRIRTSRKSTGVARRKRRAKMKRHGSAPSGAWKRRHVYTMR